jgi:hypothetical protein
MVVLSLKKQKQVKKFLMVQHASPATQDDILF